MEKTVDKTIEEDKCVEEESDEEKSGDIQLIQETNLEPQNINDIWNDKYHN